MKLCTAVKRKSSPLLHLILAIMLEDENFLRYFVRLHHVSSFEFQCVFCYCEKTNYCYQLWTQKFLTDNFDSSSRNHSNINFSPKLKFVMFATLLYILRYIFYKITCVCVQKNVTFASKKVSLILIYFFESLKDFELNNKII